MSRVVRYTHFVTVGKHALWAMAALVVGILGWIASGNRGDGEARLVFTAIEKTGALEDIMIKPRYQGIDARGRPFTVTAETATQKDKDMVKLISVNADMMVSQNKGSGRWLGLTAADGMLNMKTKKLDLGGGVSLFADGGYEFRSDHAQVDIAQGTAYGDAKVEGQGPTGTLIADGFSIAERGRILRFNGSVKMKLYR